MPSYRAIDIKREQKKMNRLHKKIRKEILKEADLSDRMEMDAFALLESVNHQFDNITRWIDETEKLNKNN